MKLIPPSSACRTSAVEPAWSRSCWKKALGRFPKVIAPSDRGKGGSEELDGVPVTRVRYAAPADETFAQWRSRILAAPRLPGPQIARGSSGVVERGSPVTVAGAARDSQPASLGKLALAGPISRAIRDVEALINTAPRAVQLWHGDAGPDADRATRRYARRAP